jgi:hypothetical protein
VPNATIAIGVSVLFLAPTGAARTTTAISGATGAFSQTAPASYFRDQRRVSFNESTPRRFDRLPR